MAGIEPNIFALLIFGVTFAAFCLGFFTMTGMFPLRARPHALAGMPGAALIAVNLMLLIALLLGVAWFAHQSIRWSSAVIFGGLIFLFIPSVFQAVPSGWRDSRGGLVALGVVQIAALATLLPSFHVIPGL